MSRNPRGWSASLLLGLTDLVWPRSCRICDVAIDASEPAGCLCLACRTAVCADRSETCPRCTSTVGPHTDLTGGCSKCQTKTFHFARAVRLGPYDGVLRTAILRMKQESGEIIAEELGRIFAETWREKLLAGAPELVMAIPLHWRRRWQRGYNQSEVVARELARTLKIQYRAGCLVRIRPTQFQPLLAPTARWENVRGAFQVSRKASVRGIRILLVDDVLTTGATADSASKTLREAGAAQVTVAILAHR